MQAVLVLRWSSEPAFLVRLGSSVEIWNFVGSLLSVYFVKEKKAFLVCSDCTWDTVESLFSGDLCGGCGVEG